MNVFLKILRFMSSSNVGNPTRNKIKNINNEQSFYVLHLNLFCPKWNLSNFYQLYKVKSTGVSRKVKVMVFTTSRKNEVSLLV